MKDLKDKVKEWGESVNLRDKMEGVKNNYKINLHNHENATSASVMWVDGCSGKNLFIEQLFRNQESVTREQLEEMFIEMDGIVEQWKKDKAA